MANDDGFQVVSRGVRPRQHVRSGRNVCCDSGSPTSVEIVSSVLRTREDLNMVQYATQIEGLLEDVECEDLICYGIGLFGTCRIARLQLTLLLHIASVKQVRLLRVTALLHSAMRRSGRSWCTTQCSAHKRKRH
jgi:hypothetical protein